MIESSNSIDLPSKDVTSTQQAHQNQTASSVLRHFDDYKQNVPGGNAVATDATAKFDHSAVYPFKPKYEKSTKNNPLCGICFPEWIAILKHRYHQIDWCRYWPRLLMISCLSLFNSLLSIPERFFYGQSIQETVLHPSPVFVLGHPRTGTTLLHSLLALDEEQFAVCTTFCSGFPSCFLWFEQFGKRLFSNVMDKTRPMDNVELNFDLPQEDELAINVLSGGVSPYMSLFFMRQEEEFCPYYAFMDNHDLTGKVKDNGLHDDDNDDNDHHPHHDNKSHHSEEYLPPDQMAKARKTWTQTFLYLLRKLTLRAKLQQSRRSTPPTTHQSTSPLQQQQQQQQPRLLLKSPVHTARIPLLLQLFPRAQFIYVHRNPMEVFQSAAHMADTTYWYTYLNQPCSNQQIQEFILRQYEILWNRYQQGKKLLKEKKKKQDDDDTTTENNNQKYNLVEISFEELERDPVGTMEFIYESLGWKDSGQQNVTGSRHDKYFERLRNTIGSTPHQSYKRNRYVNLSPELQKVVLERWGPSFEILGYDTNATKAHKQKVCEHGTGRKK